MRPFFEVPGVRLYCADCREVLPMFDGADAVVTDPPYGIGFAAQPTDYQRINGFKPQRWDDAPADVTPFLSIAPKVAVWGGNYFPLPLSRGWIAWTNPDAPPSMGSLELCWTNADKCAAHIDHSIAATNAERVGHPTQSRSP